AGKPVRDMHELLMQVAWLPPGKAVDLQVVRDGKPLTLHATMEEQPKDFAQRDVQPQRAPRSRQRSDAVSVDKIGVQVSDLTREQADRLGFRDTAGALVVGVDDGSLAEEAGVRSGQLITKVDRQPVKSAAAFKEMVEKGSLEKGVLVQTESPGGGTNFFLLKAAAPAAK